VLQEQLPVLGQTRALQEDVHFRVTLRGGVVLLFKGFHQVVRGVACWGFR
jgi:hypothetical protein